MGREQLGCRMLTQGPADGFLSIVSAVLVVLIKDAGKEGGESRAGLGCAG